MSYTFVSATSPDFAAGLAIGGKAGDLNNLLAELESEPTTPAVVIGLVKNAYVALNTASLAMLDRAIGDAKAQGHYTQIFAAATGGVA